MKLLENNFHCTLLPILITKLLIELRENSFFLKCIKYLQWCCWAHRTRILHNRDRGHLRKWKTSLKSYDMYSRQPRSLFGEPVLHTRVKYRIESWQFQMIHFRHALGSDSSLSLCVSVRLPRWPLLYRRFGECERERGSVANSNVNLRSHLLLRLNIMRPVLRAGTPATSPLTRARARDCIARRCILHARHRGQPRPRPTELA